MFVLKCSISRQDHREIKEFDFELQAATSLSPSASKVHERRGKELNINELNYFATHLYDYFRNIHCSKLLLHFLIQVTVLIVSLPYILWEKDLYLVLKMIELFLRNSE